MNKMRLAAYGILGAAAMTFVALQLTGDLWSPTPKPAPAAEINLHKINLETSAWSLCGRGIVVVDARVGDQTMLDVGGHMNFWIRNNELEATKSQCAKDGLPPLGSRRLGEPPTPKPMP